MSGVVGGGGGCEEAEDERVGECQTGTQAHCFNGGTLCKYDFTAQQTVAFLVA